MGRSGRKSAGLGRGAGCNPGHPAVAGLPRPGARGLRAAARGRGESQDGALCRVGGAARDVYPGEFLSFSFHSASFSPKASSKNARTRDLHPQTSTKKKWDAVALALVGGDYNSGGGSLVGEALSSSSTSTTLVDPLAMLISSGGGAVGAAVGAFSLLAIVTSCLGTALGLSSTLTAEIKGLVAAASVRGEKVKEAAAAAKAAAAKSSSSLASNPLLRALSTTLASFSEDDDSSSEEDEEEEGELALLSTAATTTAIRVAAFALVLGPPLAASLANPGSFFGVLNAVGGYGMTALYGVLPPLMAWKLRERQDKEREGEEKEGSVETMTKALKQQKQKVAPVLTSSFSPPLLPGGRAALTALTTASVAVEVGRLADDLEGWRRAASEGASAAAGAGAAAASSSSSISFAASSAISTAFEGFLAGSDAGEKLSSSVVAHVSELLATILP